MKAEFVRKMSQSNGRLRDVAFLFFTTKHGEKDYPFIVSSYGRTGETCNQITVFFASFSVWPSGAKSVTAEITLPTGNVIKQTWVLPRKKLETCTFDERFCLQEEAGRPLFEVELTFELGQPDRPKPRKSPYSPFNSPIPR